jgi:hypothetical protein
MPSEPSSVSDLTPKFPSELLPMIKFLLEEIHSLSGFPPIMQGQGEPGVRAGSHANTLMKTASPTLRDRALIVERQCADHADLSLSIREAKDPQYYWTDGSTPEATEKTRFLLTDLPHDWRVTIDSHSSSPIFSDENVQLVFALQKLGIVDGEFVIGNGFDHRPLGAVLQLRALPDKTRNHSMVAKMLEGLRKIRALSENDDGLFSQQTVKEIGRVCKELVAVSSHHPA